MCSLMSLPQVSACFPLPLTLLISNHSCCHLKLSDEVLWLCLQISALAPLEIKGCYQETVENEEGASIPISVGLSPTPTSILCLFPESGTLCPPPSNSSSTLVS